MGVSADLALITIDPVTGKSLLGMTESDAVFGGAVLVDLVFRERVAIEGEGKKARVRLADPTLVGDAALDQALGRIKPGSNTKAASLVPRLGKGSRPLLLSQLVAERAIWPRKDKVLGIYPVIRHDVTDPGRHALLVGSVESVLLGRAEADDTAGPLIALLLAGNVVKRLVPKPDRKQAVARAKAVADGEWAGEVSKAAIDAANAAIVAATTAAAVAASAAGTG